MAVELLDLARHALHVLLAHPEALEFASPVINEPAELKDALAPSPLVLLVPQSLLLLIQGEIVGRALPVAALPVGDVVQRANARRPTHGRVGEESRSFIGTFCLLFEDGPRLEVRRLSVVGARPRGGRSNPEGGPGHVVQGKSELDLARWHGRHVVVEHDRELDP